MNGGGERGREGKSGHPKSGLTSGNGELFK